MCEANIKIVNVIITEEHDTLEKIIKGKANLLFHGREFFVKE